VTIHEAIALLQRAGVPDYLYVVGELGGGECHGVDYRDERWLVYFSERGLARSVRAFTTEAAAAAYFVWQFKGELKARGASPPAPPTDEGEPRPDYRPGQA
jgi:hypothetical protein